MPDSDAHVYPRLTPWLAINSSQFLSSLMFGQATVGACVGPRVGDALGLVVVGAADGASVGKVVGAAVGASDGDVGACVKHAQPAQL